MSFDHDLLMEVRNDVKHLTGKVDQIFTEMSNVNQRCVTEQVERAKILERLESLKTRVDRHEEDHKEERNKLIAALSILASVLGTLFGWLSRRL